MKTQKGITMDGILSVEVGEVRTTESAKVSRRNFAKHLAEKNPKIPPTKLMKAVKKKFGRGIEFYGAKAIIAEAKKNFKKMKGPGIPLKHLKCITDEELTALAKNDFQREGIPLCTRDESQHILIQELNKLADRIMHSNVTTLHMELVDGSPVWTGVVLKEVKF